MMLWESLIVLVLILLNGFFAMSELAVVSSRRARLQHLAERRQRGAAAALRLVEDPGRFLSTVQVGITLVGIFAGAYGGATLADRLGEHLERFFPALAPRGEGIALALVVVTITYLTLILGELVPKRIALTDAEGIAARVARPMRLLSRAAAPVVWLLGASTDLTLRLLRVPATPESTVTEEEVRMMIAEGAQRGVFEPAEREMIDGVLRLADRTVRSIMTPRPEIMWLDPDDAPEAIAREIRESGFSRFLVSRGDVDEVLGVVQTKDLLDRMLRGRPPDLMACLREPLIVHDGTPVLRLLDLFKQSGMQLAVVVDEYGSVEGLVTLTDILETIAGEIPEPGEEAEPWAVRRDDGSWLIDGMAPIDQVEARTGLRGLRGEDGGFHTLAGFVLSRLRRVPTAGDRFEWQGARFEVVDMDGRRVDKVLVAPPPEEVAPPE